MGHGRTMRTTDSRPDSNTENHRTLHVRAPMDHGSVVTTAATSEHDQTKIRVTAIITANRSRIHTFTTDEALEHNQNLASPTQFIRDGIARGTSNFSKLGMLPSPPIRLKQGHGGAATDSLEARTIDVESNSVLHHGQRAGNSAKLQSVLSPAAFAALCIQFSTQESVPSVGGPAACPSAELGFCLKDKMSA
ncbi:hypothetical protein E4U53_001915 [Claviceps sorghi]|nr:hypothetical protein E4U53_001915 [Claviceps sorghi]